MSSLKLFLHNNGTICIFLIIFMQKNYSNIYFNYYIFIYNILFLISNYKVVIAAYILEKAPNASEYEEFWESMEHVCSVASGNVCIKYTFTYNNESKYITL